MKNDTLKTYLGLRDALLKEKGELEARLQAIKEALAVAPLQGESTSSSSGGGARRGRRPGAAGLSLKTAVLRVLEGKSLTKEEILNAVKGVGYQFTTKNPMNSLGVILYGKAPKFKNEQGKFSLGSGQASSSDAPQANGKRKMSPQARARIAAAQRARWAARQKETATEGKGDK